MTRPIQRKQHVILAALITGGVVSIDALAQNIACPDSNPCEVIFTLDAENNIVLEDAVAGNRSGGILRLTEEQANKAAAGPVSVNNILMPKVKNDDFANVINELSTVPGLGFMKSNQNPRSNKTASARPKVSVVCSQMMSFMKATLDDAKNGVALQNSDFVTYPEVILACGEKETPKIMKWYDTERLKTRISL